MPRSGDHAIVEVVFGIDFSRDLTPSEIEGFARNHGDWKDDLPRLGREASVQFVFSGGAPAALPSVTPNGGVNFERVKPDGNLEWRVRAAGRSFLVNCLNYDGWTTVWPRVRGYFNSGFRSLLQAEAGVSSLLLQYIDIFEWRGETLDYNITELLDFDSSLIVDDLSDKGPLWHLHTGWYRREEKDFPGRVLERLQIDGVEIADKKLAVKIETYIRLELDNPIEAAGVFEKSARIDLAFEGLHIRSKQMMNAILNERVAKEIGLNVTS